jgi:hypothetical protein
MGEVSTTRNSDRDSITYRARLHFRVRQRLNIGDAKRTQTIAGRDVLLSGRDDTKPIKESEWLVLNAKGFTVEEEARVFGHKLRVALEASSVVSRLGADVGRDLATLDIGQSVRQAMKEQFGTTIRNRYMASTFSRMRRTRRSFI